jgi:hypothetical protein
MRSLAPGVDAHASTKTACTSGSEIISCEGQGGQDPMTNCPSVKLGAWISVEGIDCVVSRLRPRSASAGDCEVVFNPSKPINVDVRWTGEAWEFVKVDGFGGYANKYNRLQQYVAILKSGRR